jgi:hypothetical protein
MDKIFNIILLDVSHKPQKMTPQAIQLPVCQFHLSFTSSGYQLQKHFTTDGIGRYEFVGNVDAFLCNQENFQRYQEGQTFSYYKYFKNIGAVINATINGSTQDTDLFLVFRNRNRLTHEIIDFSLDISVQTPKDRVQIVTPDTMLFETPISNIGDTILISGISTTDPVYLSFDHEPHGIQLSPTNGEWSYTWNTSGEILGTHLITISDGGNMSDERSIQLVDGRPPSLSIDTPLDGEILEQGFLNISGHSSDNLGVDHVEVTLNNYTVTAGGTSTWHVAWDMTGLSLGDHLLSVKAVDTQGLVAIDTCSFVLNESGHVWGPQINAMSYIPVNPINTSNMIIYANVTTTGPFAIQTIILYCYNGTDTVSYEMYRYGDYPVQSRHEEDPLLNQSNNPLFGVELGQFPTGQSIGFWIVAVDTAHNRIQSEGDSFTIQ